MKREVALSWLAAAALPAVALSAMILILPDAFDSYSAVRVAQMEPRVIDATHELEAFLGAFVPRNLSDLERALGRPTGSWPDSTYAIPLCQNRQVGIGGLHMTPSRSHTKGSREGGFAVRADARRCIAQSEQPVVVGSRSCDGT